MIHKTMERRNSYRTATKVAQRGPQQGITPTSYFRWKGALDRCLAAALLIPGLPMIGLLVLLVRLTSRGPGTYKQVRVGKDGLKFMMYKIRTMRHDAEAATGPRWTHLEHDPRITRLGRVLRKLHLDELPQLFNVLQGDMSLTGPRPERPEFVRVLAQAIPGYWNRLAVPPGVTGLAQVNLPADTDLTSVERKLVLDCEYIRSAGLWMDTRLMLCTFLRIFKVPERWLLTGLRVGRNVTIPPHPAVRSGNGDQAGFPAEATPAAILLQLGDPSPPPTPPSANGKGNGNGCSNSNGKGNGFSSGNGNGCISGSGSTRDLSHPYRDGKQRPNPITPQNPR
jgi:lipopolysaccharide/colanic/teichoic acid biosynthesis glycosyltransferase